MNHGAFSWRRLSRTGGLKSRLSRATGIAVILPLAAGALVTLGACGGTTGSSQTSAQPQPANTLTPTESAAPAAQTPAPNTVSAGTYLVGTDIPAGIYKGRVIADSGYWQIGTDSGGANLIANADVTGPFYVQVKKGQYLELRGVELTKVAPSSTPVPAPATIGAGTYLVGSDIPAGLYRGKATGSPGYWQISSDANGSNVIVNADVTGQFYVEVTKGQYLQLSGAELAPATSANASPRATTVSDGTYLVGTDIPAGRYRGATTGDWGSWRISRDANGSDAIANNVSGVFYLQVRKGQFLDLASVKIKLVD